MNKKVFLTAVAALAVVSFACSSVPFMAHATKTPILSMTPSTEVIPPTATTALPTNTPRPTSMFASSPAVGVILPTKDEPRWIQDET